METKKVICVLSGGADSTTLLYELVAYKGIENIYALSFNYNSKHNQRELPLASQSCTKLGVKHKIIDVKSIFENYNSALLNHRDSEPIPEGHYKDENMKKTVVPFRNGILLSIAVGFAESIGAKEIYYGAHAGDHQIYPDCRPKFIKAISKAAKFGTFNKIKIIAPYSRLNKTQIIKKGIEFGVDYKNTWTCYNPTSEGLPCEKCGACIEREEAFLKNKIKDPLKK
jgi:7-cyano-7-deazaguanine synthase